MANAIPWLFRYNTLLSVPAFTVVIFLLLHRTKAFSYSQLTVSKSIHLLQSKQKNIFRLNFVIKAIIDAGFVWYIAVALGLSVSSPLIILWTVTIVSFGLFAYFTDDRSRRIHEIFVYAWIVLWLLVEIVSSWYLHSVEFTHITFAIVALQAVLAFGAGILKRTNAVIQFTCVFLLYIWLVLFVNALSPL